MNYLDLSNQKGVLIKMNNNVHKWLKCAGIRAVKTMAQTALSLISVGAVMSEIDWVVVGSASLVAGIYSLLTSVAGLPEVEER